MTEKYLTFDELHISMSDIYMQMGYDTAAPDEDIARMVEDMVSNIRTWLKACFVFFVTYGTIDHEHSAVEVSTSGSKTVFSCSPIITRQLKGAEACALFIATAGTEYQQFIDDCADDILQTFIADAIGSVIAEACGDRMEETLQEQINKLNWNRTNRFSPGYCGWHVKEQQKLFPLFNGKTAGVALTDSSLMMPIKSISGIIGLGPDVRYLQYTCGICTQENCYKRRKPARKATSGKQSE